MATRDEAVEIPVDGRGIPGTVVAPAVRSALAAS